MAHHKERNLHVLSALLRYAHQRLLVLGDGRGEVSQLLLGALAHRRPVDFVCDNGAQVSGRSRVWTVATRLLFSRDSQCFATSSCLTPGNLSQSQSISYF